MPLKSLFGKLVKNFGDDALKFAANKGDDAIRVLDKVDDLNDTGYFKALEASVPDFDYSAHLAQVDADSALRDAMFDELSRKNEFRLKMDGIDNALLKGDRLGHYLDVPEYVKRLSNPTDAWKTSTPLKQGDARLANLYDQLSNRLTAYGNTASTVGHWPRGVLSKEDLTSSLDEVDRMRKALERPEQLKFEF